MWLDGTHIRRKKTYSLTMHWSIETSHWPKLINMRHFRFLKTLPPNGPFPSNSFFYFFLPKKPLLILRVKPLFFSLLHLSLLSFSSLFLFLLSFSFPAYRTPFHSNDWKFDRLVFKKSARSFQRILPIFQSVPF